MLYMIEYTLFATLAFHHLSIGLVLLGLISLINLKLVQNAELKSWLWMSAFFVATITPFALINFDNIELNETQTNQVVEAIRIIDEVTQNKDLVTNRNSLEQNYSDEKFWHLPPSLVFDYSYILTAALLVWLLGSIWRFTNVLLMWFRTKKLTQDKGELSKQYTDYLGLKVYVSEKVSSPMVLGYFSMKVIMPAGILAALDEAQIHAILQHEKAHIARKDNFFALFQECVAIAFWWSPVMRILNKKIHIQREMACDIRAANNCASAKQYAQSLLDCAKLMVHQHKSVLAMGLFSKKKELKKRISLVLTNKEASKVRTSIIVVVCALFSISSIQAAQMLAPQVNIKQTTRDALHYSILPFDEGQALISAVMQNDIDTVTELQSYGVDINTPAIGDGTALMIAIKTNNLDMAKALIELGADVNQSSIQDGNPLIIAAVRNNIEAAELLLAQGADIDAVVERDETALINASYYGNVDMVVFLLENGAEVNIAVTTGKYDGYEVRSALSRARNDEISAILLANGAVQ